MDEDEYNSLLDVSMLFTSEEFNSNIEEGALFGYYDSSSPDRASKNIVSERNRRQKLTQRLYALRSVVPNITKLDKASTVKDAIGYIESLHQQERKIKAEIAELESGGLSSNATGIFYHHSSALPSHPIELIELRVSSMREGIIVVSLTCSKKTDTMVKLCEIFESLNLKIITVNITTFSGRLFNTVFLQGDDEEKEVLSSKIRGAIAALNDPESPMSI